MKSEEALRRTAAGLAAPLEGSLPASELRRRLEDLLGTVCWVRGITPWNRAMAEIFATLDVAAAQGDRILAELQTEPVDPSRRGPC